MTAQPHVLPRTESNARTDMDIPYVLLVWNDPVNLMSYVSYVFRAHFGYSEAKANELMLEVHQQGRSVVSTGPLEKIEADVAAMHAYGLWATFKRADES
jgi:ATP-dependent Clp protease adaptor protein ClpS